MLMKRGSMIMAVAIAVAVMATVSGEEAGGKPQPAAIAAQNEARSLQARLLSVTTKNLDRLIDPTGHVVDLKGKSADGMAAFAFYLIYEMTGEQKYRTAATELTDQVLRDMRATKHGVLYIKEKENDAGESIPGGGPPAFGWYTAKIAYIYHKEGGRDDELKYIAGVVDDFPWNEQGWWASSIDIETGESKEPLTKPSPINKNAAMAMAAGMISEYIKDIAPALSARLKNKADKCIYSQIIPAQEPDGFWHYSLGGNDPKDKDLLGYFMITADALLQLQMFTGSYHDPAFQTALDKACTFALKTIEPMTDPNKGPCPPVSRTTPATPVHFSPAANPRRGFSLGVILCGGANFEEAAKIIDHWTANYAYGGSGEDDAHAFDASVLMLRLLQ